MPQFTWVVNTLRGMLDDFGELHAGHPRLIYDTAVHRRVMERGGAGFRWAVGLWCRRRHSKHRCWRVVPVAFLAIWRPKQYALPGVRWMAAMYQSRQATFGCDSARVVLNWCLCWCARKSWTTFWVDSGLHGL